MVDPDAFGRFVVPPTHPAAAQVGPDTSPIQQPTPPPLPLLNSHVKHLGVETFAQQACSQAAGVETWPTWLNPVIPVLFNGYGKWQAGGAGGGGGGGDGGGGAVPGQTPLARMAPAPAVRSLDVPDLLLTESVQLHSLRPVAQFKWVAVVPGKTRSTYPPGGANV